MSTVTTEKLADLTNRLRSYNEDLAKHKQVLKDFHTGGHADPVELHQAMSAARDAPRKMAASKDTRVSVSVDFLSRITTRLAQTLSPAEFDSYGRGLVTDMVKDENNISNLVALVESWGV